MKPTQEDVIPGLPEANIIRPSVTHLYVTFMFKVEWKMYTHTIALSGSWQASTSGGGFRGLKNLVTNTFLPLVSMTVVRNMRLGNFLSKVSCHTSACWMSSSSSFVESYAYNRYIQWIQKEWKIKSIIMFLVFCWMFRIEIVKIFYKDYWRNFILH